MKDNFVNTCSVYFVYRKNCTRIRLPLHFRFQNDILVTSMMLMKECNIYSSVPNKWGLKKRLRCSLEVALIRGEINNQEMISGGRGRLLETE